ncbi:uncharacterized protein LOC111880228 [Lactuca sativa]|uniref:uncharacterized protein LOC111880228 n=1 Tax=Lactuca sativa TaxID=4236 RepID=UPI000CD90CEE|nr:uncharacterized protein LOC111880228 [Lactuca sativa]
MTEEKDNDPGASKKNEEPIDANSINVNDVLNDNNFNKWRQEMINFLFAKNKKGFVDGSINKPDSASPMHMAWMCANAMVKGWLTTAMERDIQTSVRYANTSAEIWKDLEERFEKEGAPQAYELKQSLNTTRQDGTSVSSYYTKLKTLCDELQLVLPTSRCTCDGCNYSLGRRLNEVKEKERIYEFLMGLDEEFSIIRTQILTMNPPPSLGSTYHLVAKDEQQMMHLDLVVVLLE